MRAQEWQNWNDHAKAKKVDENGQKNDNRF